jgi:hypothetical protein
MVPVLCREATVLLAPSVVGLVADGQSACCLADGLGLAQENLSFSQLPDDFFRALAPSWHVVLPPVVCHT